MKHTRLLTFLFQPFFLFSQETEKRLALVIGNSNYDKGELKNPVNDARLIASTLDSLDFDVILKENLSTKRDMTAAIREFGTKRSEYDVAFVYYAGHGIQVDDENFLLPTKEVFEEEFDVLDYGVSVQNIMRYLRAQTNQVNILILDACRDNPFESKWNTTRSLKSQGLAKIPPPTGSLIAFSTDSGQTAPDGDGENSVYTTSLAKNMLLEDTSIDQVFRNVRAEVLAQTNGIQRPVEATQLTGQTFYLKKPSPDLYIENLNELILHKKFDEALKLSTISIFLYPKNSKLLAKKGHINSLLGKRSEAFVDYNKAIELNPKESEAYFKQIIFKDELVDVGIINLLNYVDLGKEEDVFNKWIINDSLNVTALQERARYYNWDIGKIDWEDQTGELDVKNWLKKYKELALNDLFKALEILENKKNHNYSRDNYLFYKSLNFNDLLFSSIYVNICYVFLEHNDLENALKYANLAVSKNQKQKIATNGWSLYIKAKILAIKGEYDDAIKTYHKSIEQMPGEPLNFLEIGSIYNTLGKYDLGLKNFNYAVELAKNDNGKHKDGPMFMRSIFNYTNKRYYLALEDLNLLEYNSDNYNSRIHLIKSLIYNDLGIADLAKRDLKRYLLGCCYYDVDGGENWFENLANDDNTIIRIPFDDFYKSVYIEEEGSKSNEIIPWKGDKDLSKLLKKIISN